VTAPPPDRGSPWRAVFVLALIATVGLTWTAVREGGIAAPAGALVGGLLALACLWRDRERRRGCGSGQGRGGASC